MTVKTQLTVTKWTVLKMHTLSTSVMLDFLTAFFETNASSVNNPSALGRRAGAAKC